ncbi:hypothetical protein AT05_07105 [Schleiferia thermophila str. Yellowstone]|nr:hypothetical protein AT05_07105 [Schleiferia thermophila str. Yellowstone]
MYNLQIPVRTIAFRGMSRMFTATQCHFSRFLNLQHDRPECTALMRSIAKGLFAAFSTCTPPVFTRLQFQYVWRFLGNLRSIHVTIN